MTLVFALLTANTAQASTLDLTGTCGGPVQIDATGLTPGAAVAVLSATAQGGRSIPVGPCAGTATDLGTGLQVQWTGSANASGELHLSPNLPAPNTCDLWLQVVDAATCTLTPTAQVPDTDRDEDGYPSASDCDDANPHTYPGAPELCDGVQNDCDAAWVNDDGLVSWFALDGTTNSLTGLTSIDLTNESGTLRFCDGDHELDLSADYTSSDITIESLNGAATTSLRAPSESITLWPNGDVAFQGLTLLGTDLGLLNYTDDAVISLTDVVAEDAPPAGFLRVDPGGANPTVVVEGVTTAGYALIIDLKGGGELTLSNVSQADVGLGIEGDGSSDWNHTLSNVTTAELYLVDGEFTGTSLVISSPDVPPLNVSGSNVTLTDVTLQDSPGAIVLEDSFLYLIQANVSNNHATLATPLFAGGSSYAVLTFYDSSIVGNTAADAPLSTGIDLGLFSTLVTDNVTNAEALVEVDGGLFCSDEAYGNPSGFLRNTAASGTVSLLSGSITSWGCDWGTGIDDNAPTDVVVGGVNYAYGDDATFDCSPTLGCY